jgi:hypothetical protein
MLIGPVGPAPGRPALAITQCGGDPAAAIWLERRAGTAMFEGSSLRIKSIPRFSRLYPCGISGSSPWSNFWACSSDQSQFPLQFAAEGNFLKTLLLPSVEMNRVVCFFLLVLMLYEGVEVRAMNNCNLPSMIRRKGSDHANFNDFAFIPAFKFAFSTSGSVLRSRRSQLICLAEKVTSESDQVEQFGVSIMSFLQSLKQSQPVLVSSHHESLFNCTEACVWYKS